MPVRDPKRVSDGFLTLDGGMDQGKAPNLIAKNNDAFAINTAHRGGWPTPRPGFQKCTLDFNGDAELEVSFATTRFQTGGGYVSDSGLGSAISMHGGKVYRIDIDTFAVQDISIAGDPNPDNLEMAWQIQAENFAIIQDGSSKPYIYNGASARRANPGEIPVAQQMTYYMGRIWLASGNSYLAGDIVYGPPSNDRSSILGMTENQFLAQGGAFAVPSSAGNIVALKPIANINTALGQGELIVFTENNVFATNVPQDRSVWATTTNPIQRMIQLANGARSQDSVVNVNEDLFYRSDGVRSLAFSVRNAGQWGNTPISNEVDKILAADAGDYLKFASGVNFDNRMLMTCSPGVSRGHGIYHRGLVVLDFEPITGMRSQSPPAWDGIWTGLRFLKVFTVLHRSVERCFAYVLNTNDQIELWEITKDAKADNDGTEDVRIQWSIETRSMDFGSKFDCNKLFAGDMFLDQVNGEIDVAIQYRPDGYPCWIDWYSWEDCAKVSMCADEFDGSCVTLKNFQPQYRPYRQFTQPADTFDPILQKLFRVGYEFQFRIANTGYYRMKQTRFNCYQQEQLPYGNNL